MKKIVVLLALALLGGSAFAQTKSVKRATSALESNKLPKAFEEINKAMEEEAATADANFWVQRGRIYAAIANSKTDAYLAENADQVAMESLNKAVELDLLKKHTTAIEDAYIIMVGFYTDKAVESFNDKDFPSALAYFKQCLDVTENGLKIVDTMTYFNTALAAQLAEDQETAIEYYSKLVDMSYDQSTIYASLAELYLLKGEKEKGVDVIEKGMLRYPEDYNNMINASGFYLRMGDSASGVRAAQILDEVKEKWSDQSVVFFYIGYAYNQMKNYTEAEAAYLKAIEMDPQNANYMLNLALLYATLGDDTRSTANNLPFSENKKYEAMLKESKVYYEKSVPYFEGVLAAEPKNEVALQVLMAIYRDLEKNAEADALKVRLEEVRGN